MNQRLAQANPIDPEPDKDKPAQSIVVGFDALSEGKESILRALAFATLIPKTEIKIVWVPPVAYLPGDPGSGYSALETLKRRVKEILREFGTDKLADADARVHALLGDGRPAQSLSRIAFLHDASMIIVGSHDKNTSLEAFLLGSVPRKLIQLAPCPVLVMRPEMSEAVPELEEPRSKDEDPNHAMAAPLNPANRRQPKARENMPLLFPVVNS